MKNERMPAGAIVLLISAFFTAVCGVVTWRLFPIPFGTLFNTFFYLTISGLVLCLAMLAGMALRARAVWLKAIGVIPPAFTV